MKLKIVLEPSEEGEFTAYAPTLSNQPPTTWLPANGCRSSSRQAVDAVPHSQVRQAERR